MSEGEGRVGGRRWKTATGSGHDEHKLPRPNEDWNAGETVKVRERERANRDALKAQ